MKQVQSRLNGWRLACYAAPGLPLAAITLPVYVQIPTFYAVEMGLGLSAVGAALLFARIWDVVSDPVIGFLSDATESRHGRRRPWLAVGAVMTAIFGYMLLVPPDGAGPVYLIVTAMLLYTGWTMAVLPYNAWGAELSDDYEGRTAVSAARETAVIAGTLVAATIPALFDDGVGRGLGVLAVLLAVALPLSAGIAWAAVPDPGRRARHTKTGWRGIVRAVAHNVPFRRLLAAWFLNGIANGLPATLFLLYVEHGLGAPESAGPLLFVYFLSAVVGLPLWVWLGKRRDKHLCWCGAMIWACLWFALVPALDAGDTTAFLVICVATGLALGADLALPPSLQADVIDIDRAENGAQRTGVYFALWGMAQKLALALAVGMAFPLLDLAGFDPTAQAGEDSTRTGVWTLVALYAAAPIAFKLCAILLIWKHPLTRAAHAALQQKIAERN